MPVRLLKPARALLRNTPVPAILGRLDRRIEGAQLGQGMNVLDLGCGDALLLPATLGFIGDSGSLACVDPHAEMIAAARRRAGDDARVSFTVGDPSLLEFEDALFDRVLLHNVFHTLKDRGGAVREVRRVLKPGGKLWLWEPRYVVDSWQVRSYEGMFLGARFDLEERQEGLLGEGRLFVATDDPPGSRLRER